MFIMPYIQGILFYTKNWKNNRNLHCARRLDSVNQRIWKKNLLAYFWLVEYLYSLIILNIWQWPQWNLQLYNIVNKNCVETGKNKTCSGYISVCYHYYYRSYGADTALYSSLQTSTIRIKMCGALYEKNNR